MKKTFADLYSYIQDAERGNCGMHYPFDDNTNIGFHIYDGKKQVNIVFDGNPIAVFLFRPEERTVALVKVSNGIADYDSPRYVLPMDLAIAIGEGTDLGWFRHFGEYAGITKEIFSDVIGPYQGKETKIPENSNIISLTDIHMHVGRLNRLNQELNSINATYVRRCGTMVMVNSETEDYVEFLCNSIKAEVEYLRQPSVLNYLDADEQRDFEADLAKTSEIVENNLIEVRNAKEFLARYYTH